MALLLRFKPPGFVTHERKYLNSLFEAWTGRKFMKTLSRAPDPRRLFLAGVRWESTEADKTDEFFEGNLCPGSNEFVVTTEIKFYRDSRNHFTQMCFSDPKQPYGPPLAIILPCKNLDENLLRKLIEMYGEKGFDVLTVNLTNEQFLYPCVAGHAMNVVSELLEYLYETQKHRPYVFHGFSIGIYIYGEILAQFSDHYEMYRTMTNNVKGCLWDSPVDILMVRQHVGKFLYPKNWMNRFLCNRAVKRHFKKHYYDSVVYWLRARENFCNPIIRVPNVFFTSHTDPLSNPCSLQPVQKTLECNGIPIFQKTWWDSKHCRHLEKYCYEYTYGMFLFLHLANFFPEEDGKYRSSVSTASLTNLRLSKMARDNFC